MVDHIKNRIQEHISTQQQLLQDQEMINRIYQVTEMCLQAFEKDKKIFFCGNGGSAADAQHLAAELSGRYYYDRDPLDAEALNVNMSYITAVGNDYGYDAIFARSLKAKGRSGDVLFALSTSGNSPNVVKAVELARTMNIATIGMTGIVGGKLKAQCDVWLPAPSHDTPRIQETHMLMGHIICELIEQQRFPKKPEH